MRKFYLRWRYWFFDTFGYRASQKTYIGHGDFTEVNGWKFGGVFYPCDPDEE